MGKKTTPVSDRTDEQLVTAIAEWMGLAVCNNLHHREWHCNVLWIVVGKNTIQPFAPHGDSPHSAADRERVMLAMPSSFSNTHNTYKDHPDKGNPYFTKPWQVFIHHAPDGGGIGTLGRVSLGRAFCEATVKCIEYQDKK